jgi:hypothetical protein
MSAQPFDLSVSGVDNIYPGYAAVRDAANGEGAWRV